MDRHSIGVGLRPFHFSQALTDPGEIAAAFTAAFATGAKVACLCSSDRLYAGHAEAVAAGHIAAGPWVRKACERHLADLASGHTRGLRWDPEAAMKAVRFFALLDPRAPRLAAEQQMLRQVRVVRMRVELLPDPTSAVQMICGEAPIARLCMALCAKPPD